MRRKLTALAIVPVLALLFVVGTSSAALADNVGQRHYTWPAHCNTDILLYIRTVQSDPDQAYGFVDFTTCSGSTGADHVHILYQKLWKHTKTNNTPIELAHNLWAPLDLNTPPNAQSAATTGRGCLHKIDDPGGIQVNDSAWTELRYYIVWRDGSSTTVRDDNSKAFVFTLASQCH
jgi:hypothetical protein